MMMMIIIVAEPRCNQTESVTCSFIAGLEERNLILRNKNGINTVRVGLLECIMHSHFIKRDVM
jgi:hypothetical protein